MLHQVIARTFTAGTSSTAIYIGGAKRVAVEMPTFAAGVTTTTANLFFQVAKLDTDTFRRVQAMGFYSAASGVYDYEIPSNIGNKVYIVDPVVGFDHMKVEISNIVTTPFVMNVHVWRGDQ